MKNKDLQFKVRKVAFFIPVVLYFIYTQIVDLGQAVSVRFISLDDLSYELSTAKYLFSILSLICSYLFSHLYTKKKEWGYLSFVLYIAFIILSFYLISGSWGLVFWTMSSSLHSLALGILLYMSYDWFRRVRKQKELEKQNLQSELKQLKNQLNPHFLFNTLNNIDSLIHSNPERASKSLIQMSEMMRYMIYETNVPEVSLKQELTYIGDYLDLQRLQYDNPELISYRLEGIPDDIRIAPMLFIPFVENAFKHCTDKKAENAIRFLFKIQDSEIRFEASNVFDSSKYIHKDASSGIGLSVVKRRLDYLYPGKYHLQIDEENGYFNVVLKIKLA